MSLVAEFEAASSRLLLVPTLEAMPDAKFEIERQYALDSADPITFLWVASDDGEALEAALESDPTLERFEPIERTDGRRLYRLHGNGSNAIGTYRRWVELGGELLGCTGSDGRWDVQMRFPDREAFTAYHAFLESAGVSVTLYRLADSYGSAADGVDVVTPAQREALVLAYERGFFEVPRETTLGELATALDISDQAVSERLRRGQARVLAEFVM